MISDMGVAWAFQVCPSCDWCFLPMPWKAIHSAKWTAQSKNYEPNLGQISLTSKSTSLEQIAMLVDQHWRQHSFLFFWRLFHISVSSQSPKFIPHLCLNFCLCSWRNTSCTSQNELHLQVFLLGILLLFLRILSVIFSWFFLHCWYSLWYTFISSCCSWWLSFLRDTISRESGK